MLRTAQSDQNILFLLLLVLLMANQTETKLEILGMEEKF